MIYYIGQDLSNRFAFSRAGSERVVNSAVRRPGDAHQRCGCNRFDFVNYSFRKNVPTVRSKYKKATPWQDAES